MIRLLGTIKSHEQVLLENVDIVIEQTVDAPSGLKSWGGSFELPPESHIEPGGPYDLVLENGKSGDILVTKVSIRNRRSAVRFVGTGPLH